VQLRAKFDADRAALESNTKKLLEELSQKTEEQKRMQAEANLMRGRLEQLQQEQAAGMGSYGGSGGMGGPHSRRTAPSQPRGAGAATTGGADGNGHADPDPSATTALLGPDGHPLPPVPPSFLAFLTSSFRGDYLKLRHSAAVAHTLANHAQMDRAQGRGQQSRQGQSSAEEEEEIVFSDYVTKYNRRNAGQARVLVLTGQALYLFAGPSVQNLDLRRRVALRDLTKLSLSRLCTDLVVLHHATDHGRHAEMTRAGAGRAGGERVWLCLLLSATLSALGRSFAARLVLTLPSVRISVPLRHSSHLSQASRADVPPAAVLVGAERRAQLSALRARRAPLRQGPQGHGAGRADSRLAAIQTRQGLPHARARVSRALLSSSACDPSLPAAAPPLSLGCADHLHAL
jgi:hypothetical protein